MLRLALIENLRRVSSRVIADRIDRNLADAWADRLTEIADSAGVHQQCHRQHPLPGDDGLA